MMTVAAFWFTALALVCLAGALRNLFIVLR
jgi:hypothetical protein